MSLTKRELERIEDAKARTLELAINKISSKDCTCKINWDDKFTEYCPTHLAELEAHEAELEAHAGQEMEFYF